MTPDVGLVVCLLSGAILGPPLVMAGAYLYWTLWFRYGSR